MIFNEATSVDSVFEQDLENRNYQRALNADFSFLDNFIDSKEDK